MRSLLHPAFERADYERRYTRPLKLLRGDLDRQADRCAPGWWWVVLPHGACVAARKTDGVRCVRISREDAPPPRSADKWRAEVATFRRELRLDRWEMQDIEGVPGVAVLFTCPLALLCGTCGGRMSDMAMLFGDDCDHCALARKLGRREAL